MMMSERNSSPIWRLDWVMLITILLLVTAGVLFIYSACFRGADSPVSSFYKKQIMWSVVGLVMFFALTTINYRKLISNAWSLYAVSLLMLIIVLFVGKSVHGSRRWLSLFGLQVQPSEFAKLGVIIVLANFLGRPSCNISKPSVTYWSLLIVFFPFLLILKEPDLGTAAVLIPVVLMMLYVSGVPLKILGFLVLVGLMLLPLGWLGLGDYQKDRLLVFFDPGRDPLGAGWNKIQSAIAVGSGGLWGKGYLNGTQNVLGFLPRSVAPTDFIYSVIAEETGYVGSVLMLLLFAVLLMTCIRSAIVARDKSGRLLCIGVATMLFCHVFVNIAMTIGRMPITGLPLPLLSYGGSFMVSTMIAIGLVQSVYVRRLIR